jgi:acyl-CoA synthetase (NDP forming)
VSDLEALFAPRRLAVLGASRSPAKLGHRLLQNVLAHGFAGEVLAVNPSGEAVLGCPTVADAAALPEGLDLALVSLPAPAVAGAITALAARRARAAVILSSGFGEVDDGGRATQAALLATARAAGLRLVGPNCMGVYSAPARLNGTYFWDLPRAPGGLSVVSQSGAYGGLIFRHLGGRGVGVARFLSIGNQADVELAEVLEFLGDDPETRVIACFVEALRDGRRFVEVAARVAAAKPVVALKGGRSGAGRRAAGSHTGALAGTWETYRAAFAQAGVVLAEDTEEFLDAVETLARAGARRPAAPRLAIVTVSGGPSVVAADAAERAGLVVPALDGGTRAALRALLPAFAAVGNPVDLTPQVDPAAIGPAVRLVLDDPDVAGAVAVDVGLDVPAFADGVVAAAAATGKPVVAFTADAPAVTGRLLEGGIPVLPGPERAVRAWGALWRARPRRPPPAVTPATLPPAIAARLAAAPRGPLPYADARAALAAAGIPFCREALVTSATAAVAAAAGLGYPVVVKADVPGLAHKTEAGAVVLDVPDADALRRACRDLAARTGTARFVVQERVGPGVELLLGARRDAGFGPVVMAGTGGVLAEVIADASVRLAPLDDEEARAMLREGLRARLLAGPRGLPACEDAPLVRIVQALAALLAAAPRVVEVDLNPVIAAGARAVAVDALVLCEDPEVAP